MPTSALWYFFQRDYRGLSVSVTADIPIVSVDSQFAAGVSVQYQGIAISSLRTVELKIENSGNRPIARSEFDEPLTFYLRGRVLGTPQVLRSVPQGLPVKFETVSDSSVRMVPMLLNAGDKIVLRLLSANGPSFESPVAISGRIVGIQELKVYRNAGSGSSSEVALPELAMVLLLVALSFGGVVQLARKGLVLRTGIDAFDSAVALSAQLLAKRASQPREASLAKELGVENHDYKSNVLLLRLKIESQLRSLARKAGLPDRDQVRPIPQLAERLVERGILSGDIAMLIRALFRTMNRELHELESYLSSEQYADLQAAALTAVAALDSIVSDATSGGADG